MISDENRMRGSVAGKESLRDYQELPPINKRLTPSKPEEAAKGVEGSSKKKRRGLAKSGLSYLELRRLREKEEEEERERGLWQRLMAMLNMILFVNAGKIFAVGAKKKELEVQDLGLLSEDARMQSLLPVLARQPVRKGLVGTEAVWEAV